MNPFKDLFFRSKPDVDLEDYVAVVCPECGHAENASEPRVFGVLGPRGTRRLTFLIVGLILLGAGYGIYRNVVRFGLPW